MNEFVINGVRVKAMVIGSQIWFQWRGATFQVPTLAALKQQANLKRAGGKALGDGSRILAPMPGKITQIRINPGDDVKIGQVLLVMEAMKMEYTLKAGMDGTVKSLACKVGQQVTADALLAEIGEMP
jgi:acetyl/propionyl-CoA carboxylase alpha subunit